MTPTKIPEGSRAPVMGTGELLMENEKTHWSFVPFKLKFGITSHPDWGRRITSSIKNWIIV